jgi:hypothetical protein
VWSGKLYQTNGPWFGGPFNPANGSIRQAGTVTFAVTNLDQAMLTYTIDGVTVSKTLQRQTWANENLTGSYLGGYSFRDANCNPASLNGVEEAGGILNVTQSGTSIALVLATGTATCSFSGAYSQTGKLGEVDGNFNCSTGAQGVFKLYDLTATISGFTGRVAGSSQFCQFAGYIGGVTRSP